jgi:hypothetical protein
MRRREREEYGSERYHLLDRLIAAEDTIARVRAVDGQQFGDALSEGRGRTMYLCGVSDVKAAVRAALDTDKKEA